MSLASRRELIDSLRPRYKKAGRKEKGRILDELESTCGYARKHAITLLRRASSSDEHSAKARSRRSTYGADVGMALVRLWKLSRGLCSKRLVAALPAFVDALERHGELCLPESLRGKLLSLSAATADRLLSRHRRCGGISTSTPGALLKAQIPLHTFSDWQDAVPGYMEVDLVGHCGDTAVGQYVHTLTVTDVSTGWTEYVAVPNRGSIAVLMGLETIIRQLPFALRGIDSDNGTEFINVTLMGFCQERGIRFTRGRPYKKNDQCHVEQKNGAVVRPLIGFARYEGQEAVAHINKLYRAHRLFQNFFAPSTKLQDKKRNSAKVIKKYDVPKTPYARLLEAGVLSQDDKQALERCYQSIKLQALGHRIDELEAGLRRYAVRVTEQVQTTAPTTKGRLPHNLFGKKTK